MDQNLIYTIVQSALILLIGGVVGLIVKKLNEKFTPEEIARYKEVFMVFVMAVEQIGKVLGWDGKQKFEEAKKRAIAWLASKGKILSEEQIQSLIEACVAELNLKLGGLGKAP